jgi:glycosyltransferase involved in cell wall biosynthesis
VAQALGGRAAVIPAAVEVPPAPVDLLDRPVALLLADWGWPPNAEALRSLLADWPQVRATCPGAELLLAGRRAPADLGTGLAGVRVLGEVRTAQEAFAQSAVLAFPCPPTSGPKTKVLEALAAGLPVVTTEAGVEGLVDPAGASTAEPAAFSALLAQVLADPARRADLAQRGRRLVEESHGPAAAAGARLAQLPDG